MNGTDSRRRRGRVVGRVLALPMFVAVAVVAHPTSVLAATGAGIGAVTSFAARLTNYVTAIAASVAVLFIAVNGVRWTTSSGHPARQAEAKTGLVAALVGLTLALSANLIVNLVLGALT